jgi:hypothetical protein
VQFRQMQRRTSITADDRLANRRLAESSSLTSILAEMLLSALAWEADRGGSPHDGESDDPEEGLTSIPPRA